jgi:hypothetical protein
MLVDAGPLAEGFFFSGVGLTSPGTAVTSGLLHKFRMIDDEC